MNRECTLSKILFSAVNVKYISTDKKKKEHGKKLSIYGAAIGVQGLLRWVYMFIIL